MHLADLAAARLAQIAAPFVSPGSFFSLPQLAAAVLLAGLYLIFSRRRQRGIARRSAVVRRALRRRRIALHPSTHADLFYFFLNTFVTATLIGWGIISGLAVSDWSVRALHAGFGTIAPVPAPGWALRLGVTVITFLGYEIGYYIDHYLKHKIPFLWAFHKTHHTAEVLTPLTVFRVHPVDSLIYTDIVAICVGMLHGLFTYCAGKTAGSYVIDNVNVILVVFYFSLAHLQHSQFWIPFTGPLGRILLSPAHHQLHHSADPAHYNRNLGSCLAVWDWLFGTLAVPPRRTPKLTFGVPQAGDDRHRVAALVIDPVIEALSPLAARLPVGRHGLTRRA
jgi:sterol desaturase/sphingolipid hydroxylase (fatty acid hydroxylase superfamily)